MGKLSGVKKKIGKSLILSTDLARITLKHKNNKKPDKINITRNPSIMFAY